MEQLLSNPEYNMSQLTNAIQMYNSYKSQLLPNNVVYRIIGQFTEKNELKGQDATPISGLSDKEFPLILEIKSGGIATAIYNNSPNTEMFNMILNASLGVNDLLIVVQYNDTSPNLDQLLFVKSQEMLLSEEVKINLKPNDCIIVAFGKMQEDGKSAKVNVITVGKNFNTPPVLNAPVVNDNSYAVSRTSDARKGVFIGLMIVLAIAIGVLIYNITNPPKAGFRRRR
jgi:hypothetical protein